MAHTRRYFLEDFDILKESKKGRNHENIVADPRKKIFSPVLNSKPNNAPFNDPLRNVLLIDFIACWTLLLKKLNVLFSK